jgi:SRSO17 transposase
MKNLLIVLFPLLLLIANEDKVHQFSPISLPTGSVIDLNSSPCDKACVETYIRDKKPFSFMANYNNHTEFRSLFLKYQSSLNLERNQALGKSTKIALLVPSKTIGRYAMSISKTVMAYLLTTKLPFELELYDSKDESEAHFLDELNKIEEAGFHYVIAPVTKDGANTLARINHSLEIYIPTVNQKDMSVKNYLHYYGGIDYAAQIEYLKPLIQKELYIFDEQGNVSQSISKASIQGVDNRPISKFTINKRVIKYKKLFESISFENNSTAILNTQPVKTSLLLSQFVYQDINLSAILATQLSYNPAILNLTQENDIKNFYIANSIINIDSVIQEMNLLLGSDISYNWINYATTYFAHHIFAKNHNVTYQENSMFALPLINHQIDYPIEVLKAKRKHFIKSDILRDYL